MLKLYLEFRVNKYENFEKLQKMFYSLKESKKNNSIDYQDSKWKNFYDEELLKNFWWPTDDELIEYWKLYESIPINQRFNDKRLLKEWEFSSMLEAIACGEYQLDSCEIIKGNIGRLKFMTWSWPYEGAGSLRALVESFDLEIIKDEV